MLIVLVIFTFLTWLCIRQYQRASRLPCGPISFPVIGNLPQILYYMWKTGGVVPCFDFLRKKYGNIFTLWLGPMPLVNICDYETSHEVFVKHANKYADKLSPPIVREMRKDIGVLNTNGDHWQEMRRFSLQTFRNMGVGKNVMEMRIMEELDARCADIDKAAINGSTVTRASDFFDLTVGSIINSILVGKRFEENNKHEFLIIKNALDKGFEVFTAFDMILPVWFTKFFLKGHFDYIMKVNDDSKDFAAKEAVERYNVFKSGKYTVDENNLNDYTDAFLLKIQQHGEDKNFNLESLKTMILDLWITGQETTSTTLVSGFSHLLMNPHIMDKARKEIFKVTENGSRYLTLEDRPSTPYLNAVIGEVQRHASVLNINFMRYNYEPTVMGGHSVDGGCLVSAQLGALHVNDEMFKNPYDFDPERYMQTDSLLQQTIPFGLGKRSCLGEALARSELYLIFGNLLLRYQFRPHGKLSPTELNPFSAAKKPHKMEMEFIKIKDN